jgi:hypothetical protein
MPRARYYQLKRMQLMLANQSEDCLFLNIYAPSEGLLFYLFHWLFILFFCAKSVGSLFLTKRRSIDDNCVGGGPTVRECVPSRTHTRTYVDNNRN